MGTALIIKLGLRYLWRYRRLYIFLFLTLSVCFAVITTVSAEYSALLENVHSAARIHYGGDLFILGFDKKIEGIGIVTDNSIVRQIVADSGLGNEKQIFRTNVHQQGSIIFNGKAVQQKNIIGIDFNNEKDLLAYLNMKSGTADSIRDPGRILISAPVAELLNAETGDDITLKTYTVSGQVNTANLVIGGIVEDRSILGYYRCFMDRRRLNQISGIPDNGYSSIGLIIEDTNSLNRYKKALYKTAAGLLPVSEAINKKEDFTNAQNKAWSDIRYFIVSLPIFISQITDILDILKISSYFLYIMLVLITISCSLITIKIILNERLVEFGVMKSIGLYRSDIQKIIISEFLSLFLISVFSGILISILFSFIISCLPLVNIPGFEIFLRQGSLTGLYIFPRIIMNIGVMFIIVIPAIWFYIYNISVKPCVLLLSGKKT